MSKLHSLAQHSQLSIRGTEDTSRNQTVSIINSLKDGDGLDDEQFDTMPEPFTSRSSVQLWVKQIPTESHYYWEVAW